MVGRGIGNENFESLLSEIWQGGLGRHLGIWRDFAPPRTSFQKVGKRATKPRAGAKEDAAIRDRLSAAIMGGGGAKHHTDIRMTPVSWFVGSLCLHGFRGRGPYLTEEGKVGAILQAFLAFPASRLRNHVTPQSLLFISNLEAHVT